LQVPQMLPFAVKPSVMAPANLVSQRRSERGLGHLRPV
jgi:hypothetical protein